MKKVAIIYRNIAGLSGTPNTIFDHARYLAEHGYQVDLIGEKFDRDRVLKAGAGIVKIRRIPFFKNWRLKWFAWTADRLADRKYDFVAGHGHNFQQDVLSLHNCSRLTHYKIHGEQMPRSSLEGAFQDELLSRKQFSLCIANSRLMRKELIERYSVPAEKIQVVYPGYQQERFKVVYHDRHSQKIRASLNLKNDQILIGLITSGGFKKRGVDICIKAFSMLPKSLQKNSALVLIGKESRLDQYKALAVQFGLQDKVHFLPVTKKIEDFYSALDIYVHPARFEEFGQSVQEAMACGIPVIASKQVGAMELFSSAVYERVADVLDVETLCQRMESFIVDTELRQRWRQYGLDAVRKNSAEINFQKTFQIYRQAGL